ncbi:hypothetical protein PGH07_02425 [Sulfurovum sp. zt1-1]|uniref:Lipoprotein n=1 Tax=Sulfurovum zhangzhouensis TaxID=3019067 RepID=A0ABT7QW21_9BACT|nr:hypothetical protein [Sulfurovum zhangzhouensis]MDM5271028.1 hypothetical protein [Sulfurovum zhangzhouensis]
MKKLLSLIVIGLSMIVVSGCATHEKFVQKYDGWVGKDINALIAKIGYPDSTFSLPNQNKVYVYERSRVDTIPSGPIIGYGYYGYGVVGYNYQTVTSTCKLFLETNKKGMIVKWGYRGKCLSN